MAKFCSECGSKIEDNAMFCENCGAPVPGQVQQSAPQPEAQPVPQQVQQPAYQPAPQQVQQPAYQPAPQPVPQQVQQPAYQPAPQQVQQPAYQPAPQQVQQPAYQPAPQQYGDPYARPAAAPAGGHTPDYPAPKKSKTGLIIALVSLAVLLVAAAIVVFLIWKPFDKDDSSKTTPDAVSTELPAQPTDSAPTEPPYTDAPTLAPVTEKPSSGKMFATIEDYLKDPQVVAQIQQVKDSLKSSGMYCDIYAQGDALVYEYRYDTVYTQEQVEQMVPILESKRGEMEDEFQTVLNELIQLVDRPDPTCLVRFLNGDGELIYEAEFG